MSLHSRMWRGLSCLTLVSLILLALPSNPAAHDIPGRTIIHTCLKPEGERMHLLLRLPLIPLSNLKWRRSSERRENSV